MMMMTPETSVISRSVTTVDYGTIGVCGSGSSIITVAGPTEATHDTMEEPLLSDLVFRGRSTTAGGVGGYHGILIGGRIVVDSDPVL
jgi:hypothetical protein